MENRMSEKTIQIEETSRKSLEDLITIIIHSEYEKIDMINFINEEIGLPRKEFSFVGITFNNKIAEISRIFQKANLSIYDEYDEISNEAYPSIVGKAIIYDIFQKCQEADLKLDEYIEFFDEIIDKEGLKENIKRSFAYIHDCIFNDLDEQLILIDKDKQKKLNDIFNQYLAYIKIIEDYNLEDNLADSITNYLNKLLTIVDIENVLIIFGFCVIPTLEKLGLEKIIPKLIEKLVIEKLFIEHLKSEIQNNIDKENTDIKFNL